MGIAIALSFVAMMLAVIAFGIAVRPARWLKIWNPWREFLVPRNLSKELANLLPGIRLRLAMAAISMLAVAIILPMGTAIQIYQTGQNRPKTKATPSRPLGCRMIDFDRVPGLGPANENFDQIEISCSDDLLNFQE